MPVTRWVIPAQPLRTFAAATPNLQFRFAVNVSLSRTCSDSNETGGSEIRPPRPRVLKGYFEREQACEAILAK